MRCRCARMRACRGMEDVQLDAEAPPVSPKMSRASTFKNDPPVRYTGIRGVLQVQLESVWLNSALAVLIAFTVVLLVIETNYSATSAVVPRWVSLSSVVLLGVYAAESAVKVFVHRTRFHEDRMSIIDIVVVSLDIAMAIAESGFGVETDFPVMLLRLGRAMRITRAVRMLTMFPELALLIKGIACSAMAIFWGVVLLTVILLFWSILAVMLIHPVNQEVTLKGYWEEAGCERCPRAFESVQQSMLTFMQQILAGDSWGTVTVPIIEHSPAAALFFLSVFISLSLGAMNLLLAVIVESANEAKLLNLEQEARVKEDKYREACAQLHDLFRELDKDDSGTVSLDEVIEGFNKNEEFARILRTMDIMDKDLEVFFNMMDTDSNGQVEYMEFVEQIHKIKHCPTNTLLIFIRFYVMEIRRTLLGLPSPKAQRMSQNMSQNLSQGAGAPPPKSEGDEMADVGSKGSRVENVENPPPAVVDMEAVKKQIDMMVNCQVEGLWTVQRRVIAALRASAHRDGDGAPGDGMLRKGTATSVEVDSPPFEKTGHRTLCGVPPARIRDPQGRQGQNLRISGSEKGRERGGSLGLVAHGAPESGQEGDQHANIHL